MLRPRPEDYPEAPSCRIELLLDPPDVPCKPAYILASELACRQWAEHCAKEGVWVEAQSGGGKLMIYHAPGQVRGARLLRLGETKT